MAVNKVVMNTANGAETLIDLTGDNVTSDSLVVGFTAHDKSGEVIEGANPYKKSETDNTVNTQADLIQQIKAALEEKAAGVQLPELSNPGSANDLLAGRQMIDGYGNVVTGSIQRLGAQTITPGAKNQYINGGVYLSGTQKIEGDENLKAENIANGVSIFGVLGSLASAADGLPEGIAAISAGTYTSASDVSTVLNLPHDLGVAPDFYVMYADVVEIASADFANCICALAAVPMVTSTAVGIFMYRQGSSAGSTFNNGATSIYSGNNSASTFRLYLGTAKKLKAGITYKYIVGKFA